MEILNAEQRLKELLDIEQECKKHTRDLDKILNAMEDRETFKRYYLPHVRLLSEENTK